MIGVVSRLLEMARAPPPQNATLVQRVMGENSTSPTMVGAWSRRCHPHICTGAATPLRRHRRASAGFDPADHRARVSSGRTRWSCSRRLLAESPTVTAERNGWERSMKLPTAGFGSCGLSCFRRCRESDARPADAHATGRRGLHPRPERRVGQLHPPRCRVRQLFCHLVPPAIRTDSLIVTSNKPFCETPCSRGRVRGGATGGRSLVVRTSMPPTCGRSPRPAMGMLLGWCIEWRPW